MSPRSIAMAAALFAAPALGSDAFVPFKVESTTMKRTQDFACTVETKEWSLSKVGWSALIKRLPIRLGDAVKKGDLLAEVEVSFVASMVDYYQQILGIMQANVKRALSQEALARRQVARTRVLVEKGVLAAAELERLEPTLIDAETQVAAARKQVDDLRRQLDEQQQRLRSASYFAGVDGIVTEVLVDPRNLSGAYMAAGGATIARIDKPGRYIARCAALDTQLAELKVGAAARVRFEGTDEMINGKVSGITPQAKLQQAGLPLYDALVEFDRPGPILTKELTVRVEVDVGKPIKGLVIPWTAVQATAQGAEAVVLDPKTAWTPRKLRLGARTRHNVQVLSGLKSGELVKSFLW